MCCEWLWITFYKRPSFSYPFLSSGTAVFEVEKSKEKLYTMANQGMFE
jgi:hypothetical protein